MTDRAGLIAHFSVLVDTARRHPAERAELGWRAMDAMRRAGVSWRELLPQPPFASHPNCLLGDIEKMMDRAVDVLAPIDLAALAVLAAKPNSANSSLFVNRSLPLPTADDFALWAEVATRFHAVVWGEWHAQCNKIAGAA